MDPTPAAPSPEPAPSPAPTPPSPTSPDLRPVPAPAATPPSSASTSPSSGSAPPPSSSPPGPPPEELREDEVAEIDPRTVDLVTQQKQRLEVMPDGPRPGPPGARPSWRRRTYVIDWKLQLNYAGLYIATVTLFVIGFAASNLIFQRLSQWTRANASVPREHWWQMDDMAFFLVLNFVVLLFTGMGMALWAIVQSHRIAGPALRFRRAFRQMLRRDYDFHLQLRKKDYMKELATELNVLNNALKAKDLVLADAVLRVDALAKKIDDPQRAAELKELAQELADLVLPLPEPPVVDAEAAAKV